MSGSRPARVMAGLIVWLARSPPLVGYLSMTARPRLVSSRMNRGAIIAEGPDTPLAPRGELGVIGVAGKTQEPTRVTPDDELELSGDGATSALTSVLYAPSGRRSPSPSTP